MATKNVRTGGFEGIDKLPSNTLKRHPKVELNKNDLLRLLSYLEGELQARDVVIAALKAEKAKQLLYQAKYGRFGLGDPFHSMQRDSDSQKDNSFDEAAVKAMYDNQLMQLETLIATQRKAQQRMREQLAAVEKRYHKVCAELEEEKRKHAQDTAQGDDVTYMLEKDRERLKNEVDFEKSATKKLEKELKKTTTVLEEERAAAGKHKQVAIMLIKERKRLFEKLVEAQRERSKAEVMLASATNKNSAGEGASDATLQQRLQQMEAAMERQLSEFDIEREQSRAKLNREEKRSRGLEAEVEQLHQQIELITRQLGPEKRLDGPQSIEIKSTQRPSSAREVSTHKVPLCGPKVYRNTPPNTPPEVRRIPVVSMNDSPERDTMCNHLGTKHAGASGDSTGVKRAIMQFNSTSPTKQGERTITDKPIPAEKPSDLTSRVVSSGGAVFTSQSGGTTVFTTPSGTRISLNVGPQAASGGTSSGGVPRKTSPIARGTPPPVPPNKPAYIPQAVTRKDLVRPSSAGSPRTDIPVIGKPAPPTKFGITISKDKITISSPEGHNSSEGTGSLRPVTVGGSTQRAVLGSHHQGTPPPGTDRKPSQPASSIATSTTNNEHDDSKQSVVVAQSSENSLAAQPNLDFFGPEMADLQQLLVSMTTGNSSEGSTPSVTLNNASAVPPGSTTPQRPISLNVCSSPEVCTSTLHQCATSGDATQLRKLLVEDKIPVYTTTPDGTSALHCAAEAGNQDCVLVLLESGADPNAKRSSDHVSPVHAAAGEGHVSVLKILIENGGHAERVDQSGWTPLHWASTNGHRDICLILLDMGASITATTNANWTPLHCAVHSGHVECLDLLLSYQRHSANQNISTAKMVCDVINMADKDGWTITHLAATRESKECLEILMKHCELDLENKDRWGRTVMEVASKECLVLLQSLERKNERLCTVSIEIPNTGTLGSMNSKTLRDSVFNIGNLLITTETSWSTLEELLSNLLTQHFHQANVGLRTKKTARLEQESSELNGPFILGLSQDSVKYYSIGEYRWSPGTVTDAGPFSVLSANCTKLIHVGLMGWEDGCLDGVAYESLISIVLLNNYLRLVEQYKNVVFYGPIGASKTFLAKKLAKCVQHKEELVGHNCNIYVVTLTQGFTRQELVNFLIDKGCLMRAGFQADSSETPIILFDDVSKISVSEVFKDLLGVLENRGPNFPVKISLEDGKDPETFYLVPNCYIIGTMDRSKRTGVELSIQQHFRWVHLRNEVEPMKGLLQRHLYRKLLHRHGGHIPPADGSVHRAVEWVICVWQRLNEGLAKLGLSDIILGPAPFLSCPIEVGKPKSILKWLSLLWNHTIAPSVSEAVIKGSGSEHLSGGQQKVANTALYVLMQRAIVSGCPLSGQEKERYLAGFNGSNELDIKMRTKGESLSSALTPTGDTSPLEALISGQTSVSDVESPSENKENTAENVSNIKVNVEDTTVNNTLNAPDTNKRPISPRIVREARSASPRQHRTATDTTRNRSASPRLVLEQPRSSSPFYNKSSSGRTMAAHATNKESKDNNSISSEMTSTTIAASVQAASALMQRDYLKEIASPKVVSPTRLRKFGSHNKPGSADTAEETQVRQDMKT